MIAVLADGHAVVRDAIAQAIHNRHRVDVLQSSSAGEAVQLCQTHRPSLVLLELLMPGMDSFTAAAEIQRLHSSTKIAILTSHEHPDQMMRARKCRLNGFILKKDSTDELHYAIGRIMAGGFYVPPGMSMILRDQEVVVDPLGQLTSREISVLTLYAQGMSMKEIACELDVSVKTAETHRNNFGRKLGHPNRSQVTSFALDNNLVSRVQLAVHASAA